MAVEEPECPFFLNNNRFIYSSYRNKQLFEKYYAPELTIDQRNIGRSYSITAVYYFRKGYTSKAKAIINEGLNISPHNHELLVRKNMIH